MFSPIGALSIASSFARALIDRRKLVIFEVPF